ncbi:MAG: HAD-superfamily hydrolase subfamily variant 3 [Herbinix sp.]|jgi:putative hydrolase of the HAD superfamily|nr:HAD-superfamily hydrolase subfamily variant 3 [Herbinix sp.]
MIHTVVLDIGNVLAQFRWKEYLEKCGYDENVIQKIGNATVRSEYWKEWDRGAQEDDELISKCCALEPSVEKEIKALFNDVEQLVREYDYSVEFIKKLKENGYQVYLLSNYGRTHFQRDQRNFRFMKYVDGAIISSQVQYIKPEPEIYEALINRYHINPSEAVFLDDLQDNLEGAKPFGFHTILVRSYEQMIEDLKKLGVSL